MKFPLWLMFFLLTGCALKNTTSPDTPAKKPAGLIKLLSDDHAINYADLRMVSMYQGNSHLRRFYMINNYKETKRISSQPPVYVNSSRTINVINCDKNQRSVMGWTLFTKPYAEGDIIYAKPDIGQWESFPPKSIIGMLAQLLCKIPADRLKPEPSQDIRKPLLDN
ncbi:surface-adhesin E family protein [Kosakonia cowanii]|uniref:surface-adhesin E family protein n=1 Tax=Kosakonia cowanii TaxID=208223 RepID=UPI00307643D2